MNKSRNIHLAVEVAIALDTPVENIGVTTVAQSVEFERFEKQRWQYFLVLPLMWLLTLWVMAKKTLRKCLGMPVPSVNAFLFDRCGSFGRIVKENVASWRALDVIYNRPFEEEKGGGGTLDRFWGSMLNCQAVRNRLKLVKREIRQAILQFSNCKEVRLLSLAAGSAQGIIEVIAELKSQGVRVRPMLVDIDQTALDYAKHLASIHGVEDQIETVKASVANVSAIARDFHPQIIEMLGLLDYLPQRNAIALVRKIYKSLEPKGIFLTCNIKRNLEQHFVKWVINWPMIYRNPAELADVVYQAGFTDYRLVYEPLEIHGLVIARKDVV